ncbi:hypothetical protein F4808DRAFT_468525 [Astrocystis sublimbata]|nr:hypothetical protein F4808DRAFT_468525 [Astrocystis sublimbata]
MAEAKNNNKPSSAIILDGDEDYCFECLEDLTKTSHACCEKFNSPGRTCISCHQYGVDCHPVVATKRGETSYNSLVATSQYYNNNEGFDGYAAYHSLAERTTELIKTGDIKPGIILAPKTPTVLEASPAAQATQAAQVTPIVQATQATPTAQASQASQDTQTSQASQNTQASQASQATQATQATPVVPTTQAAPDAPDAHITPAATQGPLVTVNVNETPKYEQQISEVLQTLKSMAKSLEKVALMRSNTDAAPPVANRGLATDKCHCEPCVKHRLTHRSTAELRAAWEDEEQEELRQQKEAEKNMAWLEEEKRKMEAWLRTTL